MKATRAASKRKKSDATAEARQRLRDFKAFLAGQDPVALALLVADVQGTIAAVAAIDIWFRRYAAELKKRRVQ